jgi:DNA invertase Pin-like site-specific DNA recombinase
MSRVVRRSASQAAKSGSSRGGISRSDSPLPRFIPPQLCQPVEKAPSGPQWLHEIKLDGKRNDRPQLDAALARARAERATLLIAKLDRLSRDALFLLTLQKAEADFVAVDMPDANRLTVGIMALVAEHEREAISQRTKAALAAAKARGVKLGNPNGAPHWRGERAWRAEAQPRAVLALREQANDRARDLAPILAELEAEGVASANAKAKALNVRAVPTPRGGRWTARAVLNVLARSA